MHYMQIWEKVSLSKKHKTSNNKKFITVISILNLNQERKYFIQWLKTFNFNSDILFSQKIGNSNFICSMSYLGAPGGFPFDLNQNVSKLQENIQK